MNNPNPAQQNNIKLAVFCVVLAVFALSFGDAVIKSLSVSFSLSQIYVIRSAIALPILLGAIKWQEPSLSLSPNSIVWTFARSLLLACMWIAYYAALPHITLSVAAAVYYTSPLFITLFSALFTGDRVGVKSCLAIALGFAGVIIIVRPDADGFNLYVFLPMLAAILYALAMILTRTKCLDEKPKILSLSLNLTFILVGLLGSFALSVLPPSDMMAESNSFLLGEWTQLDAKGWLAMGVLAAVIVVGSIFAAVAYQNGPPSIVASFDYSYLAFSAMWGLIFFAETPDMLTITGMVMITAAGVLAVRD